MAKLDRRTARETAFKLIFDYEFNPGSDPEALFSETCEAHELEYNEFSHDLFIGTIASLGEIDAKINEAAIGWEVSRMSKVALAIVRLCAYEMMFCDETTPRAVAMNEAVELSKSYEDSKGRPFINGVINAIAKSLENK